MSTEVGWTHPPVPSALWGQRKEEGEGYSWAPVVSLISHTTSNLIQRWLP
jgi:hypothetical protein